MNNAIRSYLSGTTADGSAGESVRNFIAFSDGGSPGARPAGVVSALAIQRGHNSSPRSSMSFSQQSDWLQQQQHYLPPSAMEGGGRIPTSSETTRHKKFSATHSSSPTTGDHPASGLVLAGNHQASRPSGQGGGGGTGDGGGQQPHRVSEEPSRSRSYSAGAMGAAQMMTSPDLNWQMKMAMEMVSCFFSWY